VSVLATPALVRNKLVEVLRRDEDVRVVALAASPDWPYDEHLDLPAGRTAMVRPCVSTLAVRDQLVRVDKLPKGDVLVLLTDRDSHELGASITSRLAAQKVLPLDRWQQLTSLFRARAIDPALVDEQWAVDALLAAPPPEGYPAVQTGYLDRETALVTLAAVRAGLTRLDLDLTGLLQWSLDPEHVTRWRELAEPVRDGLVKWLAGRGGRADVIRTVLSCLGGAYGVDTVAVGLVLAALSHAAVRDDAQVPRTLLESRTVGAALDPGAALEWGRAAEGLVQRHLAVTGRSAVGSVLQRAEELLAELGATELAHRSIVLESAFTQRVRRVGAEIAAVQKGKPTGDPDRVQQALADLQAHALAGDHADRVTRGEMAVRLVRWVTRQRLDPQAPAASLAEAACRQQDDDGWVDVARARVWEGDVDPSVGAPYQALCATVDELRAEHEQRFAQLLADYTRTGSGLAELLPVEDVLADVVVPLTTARRVLLLVLDGMSTGVARELLGDLAWLGWTEHTLAPARPVLSVLPSITRVSRTSLLAGRLSDGDQTMEKATFAERGWPLFHKADLVAAGAGEPLTTTVAGAIRGTAPVVGVVVNTVDDTLDKGGRSSWTADSVDRLRDLLTLAHDSDRVVVLVSDHGHVHERGSRLESDDSGGARFRFSNRPVVEDEVELTGLRVLLGGGRVVAAWNERLRYAKIRNGYHGGASAQEVVIPLALLARSEVEVPGWTPSYHPEPDWWVEHRTEKPARAKKTARPGTRRTKLAEPGLFDEAEVAATTWIDRVLASDVVAAQLARRRGVMPKDRLAVLLRTLDYRGGAATRAVVARALNVPDGRLAGQVTAAQRVLNIDGYDVLEMDGDTVRVNVALLKTQAGVA
jgi:hypothetical protein